MADQKERLLNPERLAFVDKHRARICKLGGVVLFFIAKPRSNFFFDLGLLIALAGQSLRIWTAGQSNPGADGPIRVVKFPSDLGSFAVLCGFAVMSISFRHWLATLIVWASACSTLFWLWQDKIIPPDLNSWNAAIDSSRWSFDRVRRTREIRRFWILWAIILVFRLKMVYRF